MSETNEYFYSFKCCVIPKCMNTTVNTPHKHFFQWPSQIDRRETWYSLMEHSTITSYFEDTRPEIKYICEDHFYVSKKKIRKPKYQPKFEVAINKLIRYELMGCRLPLEYDAYPRKFKCQKENTLSPKDIDEKERHVVKTDGLRESDETTVNIEGSNEREPEELDTAGYSIYELLKYYTLVYKVQPRHLCVSCKGKEILLNILYKTYTHAGMKVDYSDMLKTCFDIEISKETGLFYMCIHCIIKLREAYTFKQQLIETKNALIAMKDVKEANDKIRTPLDASNTKTKCVQFGTNVKIAPIAEDETEFLSSVSESTDTNAICEDLPKGLCKCKRKAGSPKDTRDYYCRKCRRSSRLSIYFHQLLQEASEDRECTFSKIPGQKHVHCGRKSNDKSNYVCPYCAKKYFHAGAYETHIKTIHNSLSYFCKCCVKPFLTQTTLNRHLDEVHCIQENQEKYGRSTYSSSGRKLRLSMIH